MPPNSPLALLPPFGHFGPLISLWGMDGGHMKLLAQITASAIIFAARMITAVRGIWAGIEPVRRQRIYFANHVSHGDFILIWTVLPERMRRKTRPVAGSDYWLKSPMKEFIGRDVFKAVLIDRNPDTRTEDPIEKMVEALDENFSLILFPEGTRNATDAPLLPFKSGLYHLAKERPAIDLVPVWIDNLNRVMPKGEVVPVPLICTVTFGAPLHVGADEEKDAFLARTSAALLALAPVKNGDVQ
jgi:1-acyl-sn-glycerol-3-phosphate acyltransferase